jgi:DNA (cytosine-5)-methyltransferase 1
MEPADRQGAGGGVVKVGSLFTGVGGLDLAVQMLWPDAELAWWSEVDEAAAAAFARHPDAPNLGDVTAIDWTAEVAA